MSIMNAEKTILEAIKNTGVNVTATMVSQIDEHTCLYAFTVRDEKELVKNTPAGSAKRVGIDTTKRKENLKVSVGVRFTKNLDLLTKNLTNVIDKLQAQDSSIKVRGFAIFKGDTCLSIRKLYDNKQIPTNNVYEFVKQIPTVYNLGIKNNLSASFSVKVIYY